MRTSHTFHRGIKIYDLAVAILTSKSICEGHRLCDGRSVVEGILFIILFP